MKHGLVGLSMMVLLIHNNRETLRVGGCILGIIETGSITVLICGNETVIVGIERFQYKLELPPTTPAQEYPGNFQDSDTVGSPGKRLLDAIRTNYFSSQVIFRATLAYFQRTYEMRQRLLSPRRFLCSLALAISLYVIWSYLEKISTTVASCYVRCFEYRHETNRVWGRK